MGMTIVSSSILIIMILLFRQIFRRRVRAVFIYAMWGLAALRLLVPVSFIQVPMPSFFVSEYVSDSKNQIQEPGNQEEQLPGESAKEETESDDGQSEDLKKYVYQGEETIQHKAVEEGTENDSAQSAETEYRVDVSRGVPASDTNAEKENRKETSGEVPQDGEIHRAGTQELFSKEQTLRLVKGIWLSVAAILFFVVTVSNLVMYRRLKRSRTAVMTESHPYVYKSELVCVPCLYGLIRPAVYLTPQAAGEAEEKRKYIICHERMHFRHLDFLWAALRIFLVCMYWFHPLVWVAAKISRRDAEYAADEAVIRDMAEEERVGYGESILRTLRAGSKKSGFFSIASTACSSKKEIKKRMIFISETKKHSVVAAVLLLLVAAMVTACSFVGRAEVQSGSDVSEEFLNMTKDEETGISMTEELDEAVREVIRNGAEVPAKQEQAGETVLTEAYVPLAARETEGRAEVYFTALVVQYDMQEGFGFTDFWKQLQSGVVTFEKREDNYQVVDCWTVTDDAEPEETAEQIRQKFPDSIPEEKLDMSYWSNLLTARCHIPAMWECMKKKERPGSEPGHADIGSADMISIYSGDSYVGEYGLEPGANRIFIEKLVDAYNRMELQTVTEDSGVSMEISNAVTIYFWSDWKKLVQITFDENNTCWIDGKPLTYKMKENVFNYKEIVTFTEKQSRKQMVYHPMIASDIPDIVDWENDQKLLSQLLDTGNTIDGALIKKRAEQLSETEGLPFDDVYAAQRDMFVQLKRNRLAAKKHGVALPRKECSLKGVRDGIAGTAAARTLKRYCDLRGITSKQYWEYMENATMLLFPYLEYEKKIFEEDKEFQREFGGQYKSFEAAEALMEDYYRPQIDKMIRSIPVTVTAPEEAKGGVTGLDEAVARIIKEEMGMTAAADSSNRYVGAGKWNFSESHVCLATERVGDLVEVYIVRKAVCYGDKKKGFEELGSRQGFCVLTLQEKGGEYELKNWWESGDKKEIRRRFPDSVSDEQLDIEYHQKMLDEQCTAQRELLKEQN